MFSLVPIMEQATKPVIHVMILGPTRTHYVRLIWMKGVRILVIVTWWKKMRMNESEEKRGRDVKKKRRRKGVSRTTQRVLSLCHTRWKWKIATRTQVLKRFLHPPDAIKQLRNSKRWQANVQKCTAVVASYGKYLTISTYMISYHHTLD